MPDPITRTPTPAHAAGDPRRMWKTGPLSAPSPRTTIPPPIAPLADRDKLAQVNISETSAIERIARTLAAQWLSANANGIQPSAAPDVDTLWIDYRDDAIAVLKTLREPDLSMAKVGDAAIWERMILASLGQPMPTEETFEPAPPGTDPLHEGP